MMIQLMSMLKQRLIVFLLILILPLFNGSSMLDAIMQPVLRFVLPLFLPTTSGMGVV